MGKVLTLAQQKGGAGKTTLAVNLAVHLRMAGHSVAVLDTDPQGSLGRWFMTRRERLGEADMDFSTASAWGVSYEVDKLRRDNDYVIIDTPPKVDSDLRPALRESDLIVVPVSASQVDLWATDGVLELAERVKKPALLVLNRARSGTRLTAEMEKALSETGTPVAITQIANRVAYAEALGHGQGIMERARTGPGAKEVADLLDDIEAQLSVS